MATVNMYREFCDVWACAVEICEETDMLIATLHPCWGAVINVSVIGLLQTARTVTVYSEG